jgi:hypothetical protein
MFRTGEADITVPAKDGHKALATKDDGAAGGDAVAPMPDRKKHGLLRAQGVESVSGSVNFSRAGLTRQRVTDCFKPVVHREEA